MAKKQLFGGILNQGKGTFEEREEARIAYTFDVLVGLTKTNHIILSTISLCKIIKTVPWILIERLDELQSRGKLIYIGDEFSDLDIIILDNTTLTTNDEVLVVEGMEEISFKD